MDDLFIGIQEVNQESDSLRPTESEDPAAATIWSLWGSVKQKSAVLVSTAPSFLSTAKRDIQEFASAVASETKDMVSPVAPVVAAPMSLLRSGVAAIGAIAEGLDSGYASKPATSAKSKAQPAGVDRFGYRPFAQRLEDLLSDPTTYLDTPNDENAFIEWVHSFDLESRTEEVSRILAESPTVSKMHRDLVPEQVSYGIFWSRYFYHMQRLQKEEERRKMLENIAKSQDTEEDFSWDAEEEDETREDGRKEGSVPSESSASATGGESTDEAERLKAEVEKYKKQIASLKEKHRAEIDLLNEHISSVVEENAELKKKVKDLAEQAKTAHEAQEARTRLEAQVSHLSAKIAEQTDVEKELTQQNEALRKSISEMQTVTVEEPHAESKDEDTTSGQTSPSGDWVSVQKKEEEEEDDWE